jgi:hypothetical protein
MQSEVSGCRCPAQRLTGFFDYQANFYDAHHTACHAACHAVIVTRLLVLSVIGTDRTIRTENPHKITAKLSSSALRVELEPLDVESDC